jgi:hypothetical protein
LILPILDIPKEDRAGLTNLRKMPEDSFAALIIELERSPDSTPSIPGLSSEEAESLKNSIDTMYTVRTYTDVPVEELVSDVCEALKADDALPLGDESKFRDRLLRILSIDALNVAAKAVLLQNEHEHDFCSARILTDARPVYGEDPAAPPAAMIVTHTLKLIYHQGAGGRLHEIYLSLGSRDLQELRDVLNRAEAKAKSLRDVLEGSKVRFIDPQK